jgi:hypothetical protein
MVNNDLIAYFIIGVLSFILSNLIIYIAIVTAVTLLLVLPIMLKILGKIGTYTPLKSSNEQNYSTLYGEQPGESFKRKCWNIFLLNIVIGITLLISLLYTFNTISSLFSDPPKSNYIQLIYWNISSSSLPNSPTPSPVTASFTLALFLVPAILFSVRLLSNPTKKYNFLKLYYMSVNDDDEIVNDFKKDVISLYSSFVITTIAVFYASILYTAIKWSPFTALSVLLSIRPPLDDFTFYLYLGIEFFAILVLTIIGEYYLMKCEPIKIS